MTPKAEQSGVAFDQRIAKFVVRGLSKTPLTPNQVTLFSICLGLAVAWMYTQGGAMAHAAGALFIVTVWLDHVDGELARATGRTSEFGHYFDHCAAMTNYVAMFVGAGIGARMGLLDWN
ncbi:MAG: CDP-alcohol phosphatidyltransferase family protein, partial [Pseudomonadota bacterium]|nr:CDP-alcohol phosphatidyltransferase family protein [Pseudomonadota bacterium]